MTYDDPIHALVLWSGISKLPLTFLRGEHDWRIILGPVDSPGSWVQTGEDIQVVAKAAFERLVAHPFMVTV